MERGKGSTEKCDHTALAVLKQSLIPHNSNPIEQNVNLRSTGIHNATILCLSAQYQNFLCQHSNSYTLITTTELASLTKVQVWLLTIVWQWPGYPQVPLVHS